MSIKAGFFAAACGTALLTAGSASAALYTIDFTGNSGPAATLDFTVPGTPLTLQASASDFNYNTSDQTVALGALTGFWSDSQQSYLADRTLYVGQHADGLGVCSGGIGQGCSGDSTDIDGFGDTGGASDEMVVFLFSEVVRLVSVTFSGIDDEDRFSFRNFGDNRYFNDVNPSSDLFSFTSNQSGTRFGFGAGGVNSEFKISALTFDYAAPIPLPATGLLLLGALGGLAAVRRRKA